MKPFGLKKNKGMRSAKTIKQPALRRLRHRSSVNQTKLCCLGKPMQGKQAKERMGGGERPRERTSTEQDRAGLANSYWVLSKGGANGRRARWGQVWIPSAPISASNVWVFPSGMLGVCVSMMLAVTLSSYSWVKLLLSMGLTFERSATNSR